MRTILPSCLSLGLIALTGCSLVVDPDTALLNPRVGVDGAVPDITADLGADATLPDAPDVVGPDVVGPDVVGPDVVGPDVVGPDVACSGGQSSCGGACVD